LGALCAWFEVSSGVLRAWRSIPLSAFLAFFAAEAHADEKRDVAAQFFETGAAAAERGEFRVCAEAFTEAHKRAPHGATIYNAALCWENAKDLPRAANDYKEALAFGQLSSAQETQAKKRSADLETKLGLVAIKGPVGGKASVGPVTDRTIPFTTFVLPGDHEVKVEIRGKTVTRKIHVEAGESTPIEVAIPEEPRAAESPKKDAPPPAPVEQPSSVQPTIGWALLGGGVVAGGIAVGFYFSARSARDEFDQNRTVEENREKAESRVTIARAMGIAAGVLGVAGVTLILTAPKAKSPTAGALQLSLHPRGASAMLSF
jgi:hypothetical protein